MKQYTIKVSQKTPQFTELRFINPEGRPFKSRELPADQVREFVADVEAHYSTKRDPQLQALGERLYRWLDGPSERWLEEVLDDGSAGAALRIDVANGLRHLPWELLYRKERGGYLCALPTRPFTPVRLAGSHHQAVTVQNRPLRVLFMASSPENAQPVLDFEAEERMILSATRQKSIELVVEESGSLGGLHERIKDAGAGYYDVVHLSGHAEVKNGEPIFLLENDEGFLDETSAGDLADAFEGRWPRLLFLSGCMTGQAPGEGKLPSLCEALVEAGAPAVLGWALPVGDTAASVAAAVLYDKLASAVRIDEAVARTRKELQENNFTSWHLLRLYTNETPAGELVTPLKTCGRERPCVREARNVFLDAGSKMEVCAREFFVGRRRLLQRCLRVLRALEGEALYAEGLLLHGMGGLGKSSLAARLCERLENYGRIVHVGLLDEPGFTTKLKDDLPGIEKDASQALQLARQTIETLDAERLPLARRLKILFNGPLAGRPVLFILDDFEKNLEDDGTGGMILKREALEPLKALLGAIHETASPSRVLITSRYTFPWSGPGRLHCESLGSLRGSDLEKKLDHLPTLKRIGQSEPARFRRISTIAAGNPRLLERLEKVMADEATDQDAILAAMEEAAEIFREEILLQGLLEQQTPECRRLLALLAVFDLPVSLAAAQAAAAEAFAVNPLERAIALGLAEAEFSAAARDRCYYISPIVRPLIEGEITPDEKREACRRGAKLLYQEWWVAPETPNVMEALEIHRLALQARERAIAIEVAASLASKWNNQSRFREAESLCRLTLALGEDYRILHNLAWAEHVLGKAEARLDFERALALSLEPNPEGGSEIIRRRGAIIHNFADLLAQRGEVERALGLYQESLKLTEQIGDVQGKAATLTNMASVLAQRGEVGRALGLFEETLKLTEQIGDVQGKAATLHSMAIALANRGEVEQALGFFEQSLKIKEQIGDVQGKSATLANMAYLAGKLGQQERKRELNLEAAAAMAAIFAWPDLVTVLSNLGMTADDSGRPYLAQALWLTLRVTTRPDEAVNIAAELLSKIGVEHAHAPLIAVAGLFLARTRGEGHPKAEEMQQLGARMLFACAEARGISEDNIKNWFERERLNDPEYFIPALDRALEEIVGEDCWLFERRHFSKPD